MSFEPDLGAQSELVCFGQTQLAEWVCTMSDPKEQAPAWGQDDARLHLMVPVGPSTTYERGV